MQSYIVLIPPILVLAVAIIKRDVILSLVTGIISAALIATNFSPFQTISLIFTRFFEESNLNSLFYPGQSINHLYTFGFLILLGIIISLITHTGGIAAYTNILQTKLKNQRTTETTSLILSLLFFMDDYLSNLIVGCVMRPLTDKFSIPRAKLAFLIDSMSSALCVLIPATSWVALILTQLETSGITTIQSENPLILSKPFTVYLKSIAYMFYPIFIFSSSWFIIRKKLSFGPMFLHENIAQKTGNLFGGKEPIALRISPSEKTGDIWDFILPIASFLIITIILMLYSGNWIVFGGSNTLLNAFLTAKPFSSMLFASLSSLILSLLHFKFQDKIKFNEIVKLCFEGIMLMKNSLLVLLLAWMFGSILEKDLETGKYIASILLNTLPCFLLPVTIFITSSLMSLSTGSSWGTIAIMFPLAIPATIAFTNLQVPITLEQANLLLPVIGAIISGAIAGCHISPISDSTVMTSTSSGSYHMDHLTTQVIYVISPIIATIFALLITGSFANYNKSLVVLTALASGLAISFSLLYLANAKQNRKVN